MNQLYKKVEGSLFFVGILLLFAGFSQVNAAENILGDWVFTMTMPDNGMGMGAMEFTINSKITKDDKGNYAMTWEQQMTPPEGGGDFGGPGGGGFPAPQVKIENIKLDGDKLMFVQKVSFGDMGGMGDGQEMASNFAGTVKGDAIDGKLTTADNGMGMGSMEFTLKGQRKAAEKPAEATATAPKAGLEGDWVFTMTMPDNGMGMGPTEFTINSKITKDDKGNYAMTWEQQMTPPEGAGDFGGPGGGFPTPEVKNQNIKLDGDKLTFVQKVSFGDMGGMGGMEMTSNFAGTLKGDTIDGKLTSADNGMGMGPMEFTLKGQRKAAEKPVEAVTTAPKAGLEGDWEFKMTMADSGMGMGPMSFTVNSKITKDAEGKYSMTWNQVMDQPEGDAGAGAGFGGGGAMTFNVKVENIKLDGNKLTFTRKVDMGDMGGMGQGGEMISEFTGTFEGDKINGKVVGDYGEMTLTGTRKAPVKETPEAAAETAKGLAGDWEFVTTFGDMGMELRANVTFKKDSDGKYTCTWKGVPMEGMEGPGGAGAMPQPEITISDIKLDGDKVTFVQKVDLSAMQMGEMTSNYSGTLKGDKIEGAFTSDMGESKSIGTRKKAAKTPTAAPAASASGDPLIGDWQFTMSFGGGDMGMDNMEFIINSTFTKKEDGTYAGTWVRQMPEGGQQDFGGGGGFGGGEPPAVTLKDIKLDGNKLTFVQSVNFGGQEMSSNFSGTIENGKITGSMSNDMMGDMPITGTKKK